MKIRLAVSDARYDEVRRMLTERGIEIDDQADLVLSESGRFPDSLTVRDMMTNERVILPVADIVSIEAYGHSVEVHTRDRTYQAMDRLYKLTALLDPDRFLRISNSVTIAVDQVKRIAPTLSMKFVLTMSDGKKVDVTRSYYHIFRERFDI